jgi:hypothetical protein
MKKLTLVFALTLMASAFTDAQKVKKPIVKKTGSVATVKQAPDFNKNLTPNVVPRCMDNDLVINIYGRPLYTQAVKFENELLFGKLDDGTWSQSVLINTSDKNLAEKFIQVLKPVKMEFYLSGLAKARKQPSVNSIILKKDKLKVSDVEQAYKLIQEHYGPNIHTNYVSECINLMVEEYQNEKKSNQVVQQKSNPMLQ